MKAVVLEILAVVGSLKLKVIVGNEGINTPSGFSHLSTGYPTDAFGISSFTEVDDISTVVLVFQLIAELKDYTALEGPFEVLIKLSLH